MIPYRDLHFPEPPPDRPYVVLDMVATIDGKIVSGERGEDVSDLGSPVDHAVLRHLEDLADGVLIGAGTLRATPTGWDPNTRFRIAVSNSGRVEASHTFFSGPEAFVAGPAASSFVESGGVRRLVAGKEEFDPKAAFGELRRLGCRLLLALGGSRMNGSLFAAGLVDEIFLTMAPAIKLGEGLPTVAEGRPFPRGALPVFEIVEHHAVGNEIFLRYRRFAER